MFTVRAINLSITTQYENVYTFVILLVFNMLQALFVNGTIESIIFHGYAARNNFLCSIFVCFCSDGNSLCNINYIYIIFVHVIIISIMLTQRNMVLFSAADVLAD